PPGRHAAIDHIAAALDADLPGHLRVVLPERLAALRIEGIELAPGAGHVQHAIDDDGGCFLAAVRVQIEIPGQPETRNILRVDLRQRTVALLAVGTAARDPLARLAVRVAQP